MAGGVIGHLAEKPRPQIGHAEYVNEELREFISAFGNGLRPGAVDRIGGEEFGVVVDDHIGARTGRNDDGRNAVETFRRNVSTEHVQRVSAYRAGVVECAAVEGRLAATRLALGIFDLEADFFQHPHHGHPGLGPHGFDQAGSKELDGEDLEGHGRACNTFTVSPTPLRYGVAQTAKTPKVLACRTTSKSALL